MIQPNWARWLNDADGIDLKSIKEMARDTKTLVQESKHLDYYVDDDDDTARKVIKEFGSEVESFAANYEDCCNDMQKQYEKLVMEYSVATEMLATMLGLAEAYAIDKREDRDLEDVAQWCRENFNGPWEGWDYDHKEWSGGKSITKRYLIIAAFNENDRLFLKMRWS